MKFIIGCALLFSCFSSLLAEERIVESTGKRVLVGLMLWYEDYLTGVLPIYKPVLDNGELGSPKLGELIGKKKGQETVAVRNLSVVKGLFIEKESSKAEKISRIRVVWQRWSKGNMLGEMYISPSYGVVKKSKEFKLQEEFSDSGISDIKFEFQWDSSGEEYISHIKFWNQDKQSESSQTAKSEQYTGENKLVNFEIQIVSGFLEGKKYIGKFFYDPKEVKGVGEELIEVTDIQFEYEGLSFQKNGFDGVPKVRFLNGEFQDLIFVGGPKEKRFGLNDGFLRDQFGRESELFIREGKSYFGYLDEETYVEGAGLVKYQLEQK
jgi:hypothetical protein